MIIVAAGRALEHLECFAAIAGPVRRDVRQVDQIGIFGVHIDFAEIPAAADDARVGADAGPVLAGIVGAVESATGLSVDDRVYVPAPGAACDCNAAPSPVARG